MGADTVLIPGRVLVVVVVMVVVVCRGFSDGAFCWLWLRRRSGGRARGSGSWAGLEAGGVV